MVEGAEPVRDHVVSRIANRDAQYCYSPLVRLECRVYPLRLNDNDLLSTYDTLFSWLVNLPLTDDAYELATQLRAAARLRTPDAIHLAAALTPDCTEFWTNDSRLENVSTELTIRRINPK